MLRYLCLPRYDISYFTFYSCYIHNRHSIDNCSNKPEDDANSSFLLLQVAEFEGQGTATTGKRQLSRRELEEELENVKRVNKHFYNFAVRELMDEVYQATERETT